MLPFKTTYIFHLWFPWSTDLSESFLGRKHEEWVVWGGLPMSGAATLVKRPTSSSIAQNFRNRVLVFKFGQASLGLVGFATRISNVANST